MKISKFQSLLKKWTGTGATAGDGSGGDGATARVDLFDKAKVSEIMNSINGACRNKGGKYATYSCKTVSWDDVSRGTVGGGLSSWGANITDTYLKSKSGERLFTVRSDNWNEKLGVVSSSDVALVQGNQTNAGELSPITLKTFLKNSKQYGGYTGMKTEDLSDDVLDQKCSIRFQTTFLPVSATTSKGAIEFSTEAYNYNTRSDSDPRNLVLLCTTQGIALQQDGQGTKKLFHHAVDKDGKVHRYWLEAERSNHKVGGAQIETKEEKQDAIKRGKATASVIGTKAMGTRFNVLMTVQIPLKQDKKRMTRGGGGSSFAYSANYDLMSLALDDCSMKCMASNDCMTADEMDECMMSYDSMDEGGEEEGGKKACMELDDEMDECMMSYDSMDEGVESESAPKKGFGGNGKFRSMRKNRKKTVKQIGSANAARVSRGSEVDTWKGLTKKTPVRNPAEHITITVVLYFTVANGVPSEADVLAAIEDMEKLYDSCTGKGRLAEEKFDFMKSELTVKDVKDIHKKLVTQPPFQPASIEVNNFDQFPV